MAMLNPLQSHILFLENAIQSLKNRLTHPGLRVEEIEDIELQLTLSESALDHYRQAYALELNLSGSEPPSPTGTEPGGGGRGEKESGRPEKKEGLAGACQPFCRSVRFSSARALRTEDGRHNAGFRRNHDSRARAGNGADAEPRNRLDSDQ